VRQDTPRGTILETGRRTLSRRADRTVDGENTAKNAKRRQVNHLRDQKRGQGGRSHSRGGVCVSLWCDREECLEDLIRSISPAGPACTVGCFPADALIAFFAQRPCKPFCRLTCVVTLGRAAGVVASPIQIQVVRCECRRRHNDRVLHGFRCLISIGRLYGDAPQKLGILRRCVERHKPAITRTIIGSAGPCADRSESGIDEGD